MRKLKASILKEFLLLLNDKVGLFFMFFMPILLVFIITIIQNSAYQVINENKISLLISNQDEGNQGDSLAVLLQESKMFEIVYDDIETKNELASKLLDNKNLAAILIPKGFTKYIDSKSEKTTNLMLFQLGLGEEEEINNKLEPIDLNLVYDPVLQENYIKSIEGILFQTLSILENTNFIQEIYEQLGVENEAGALKQNIFSEKINIVSNHAKLTENAAPKPNATQHNIPAWTIFAMFFMVVSLSNNIVKEKNNGSFVRLKTMPTSILVSLFSKMIVYILASFLQVLIIFSIGVAIFPLIGLPTLNIDINFFSFFLVVLIVSFTAVSWALFIGVFSNTQEQAGGVGAISIIIFAAIGGVWVPTFVMPSFMQMLSKLSPMNWSLEAFYTLFLKNGNLKKLLFTFVVLTIFIIIIQTLSYLKLKKDKLI